eukprot:Nitzschia sp. Nitz4//scaffold316_size20630//855//1174//NITZ4_008654-RA/size20630-snap-gene-0.0-mRNA-1//1//CDS//3329547508//8688//frame0
MLHTPWRAGGTREATTSGRGRSSFPLRLCCHKAVDPVDYNSPSCDFARAPDRDRSRNSPHLDLSPRTAFLLAIIL